MLLAVSTSSTRLHCMKKSYQRHIQGTPELDRSPHSALDRTLSSSPSYSRILKLSSFPISPPECLFTEGNSHCPRRQNIFNLFPGADQAPRNDRLAQLPGQ